MNLIESHRVEHKQSLTDTFEKEVVAFLNYHEGGIIYSGVDKDGKIVGCQNPDETQLKIKDKLKHNIADYTTENPPVFEIFSDRIEITSTGGLSIIKNIDDFFSGYSNPTSRELMRIYKDLELVEHLGSGLNRILEAYDKDSFVIKQNYMKNIFYKNETPLNGIVSGGVNGVVSGGVTELLEFIQINPGLKANELSKHIDTPLRTVQRWLKQLKDENKIEFQGAPKTGGYVLKDMKS